MRIKQIFTTTSATLWKMENKQLSYVRKKKIKSNKYAGEILQIRSQRLVRHCRADNLNLEGKIVLENDNQVT